MPLAEEKRRFLSRAVEPLAEEAALAPEDDISMDDFVFIVNEVIRLPKGNERRKVQDLPFCKLESRLDSRSPIVRRRI